MFVTRIGSPIKGFVTTYGRYKDKGITVTDYFKENQVVPYKKRFVIWDMFSQIIIDKFKEGKKFVRRY